MTSIWDSLWSLAEWSDCAAKKKIINFAYKYYVSLDWEVIILPYERRKYQEM